MADNVVTPIGAGITFATDDVAGIIYPRTKLSLGADGSAVDVSAAAPMPIIGGTLPAGTDRSGTITAGGTSQALAAANANRKSLFGQNISSGDLWVNEIGGAAAVNTPGSWRVAVGETFSISTNRAVNVVGATTGQGYTALEV